MVYETVPNALDVLSTTLLVLSGLSLATMFSST